MTLIDDAAVLRLTSRDGTELGVWVCGQGTPLVLVHGTTSDHATGDAVRPYLGPHVMLHAMDRGPTGSSPNRWLRFGDARPGMFPV